MSVVAVKDGATNFDLENAARLSQFATGDDVGAVRSSELLHILLMLA
jgi:hypothetical protein